MSILRDYIVIVDIEATCWESRPPPEGQHDEIIEVGVCLFDVQSFTISGKNSILVKPERSLVSDFCTQLTTLTQAQVDSGLRFEETCLLLRQEYRTHERAWASWGTYDRKMFQTQCEVFAVEYPFSAYHTNIKKLFGNYCLKQKYKQVGMAQALELVGLAFEGTHHRGDDDAWNIARLLQYMGNRYGNGLLKKFFK